MSASERLTLASARPSDSAASSGARRLDVVRSEPRARGRDALYARSLRAAPFPCVLPVRAARPDPTTGRGMLGCREWPRPRSAPARSGPRCGRRDRSGVPRHAGGAVRAARPGARVLGHAEGRDAQPGPQLQGARHGDGGRRGARRGRVARGVRERRQSRAGAGLQRLASRPGGHRRGGEDRQPAQAAPDRRLRRGRAARGRGHRGRPAAGAGDRRGGWRLPGRGQPGPCDLRGRRHDRARARPRRSGARRRARGRRRRSDGQRRGLRRALARRATWR